MIFYPELLIIDEFAHANIPGSKKEKRYQDVSDVLSAVRDIISALNIRCIEIINEDGKEITE